MLVCYAVDYHSKFFYCYMDSLLNNHSLECQDVTYKPAVYTFVIKNEPLSITEFLKHKNIVLKSSYETLSFNFIMLLTNT